MLWLLTAPAAAPGTAALSVAFNEAGSGAPWSGWGIGLLGIRQRWQSPVEHLADLHINWKKQGLDQPAGEAPSDEGQGT